MTTRATARACAERLVQTDKIRRVGVLAVSALLGGIAFGSVTGSAAAGPANAVRICGERDVLLEQFAVQHRERPLALVSAPTAA
jgi:hypothetical protein